MNNSKSPFLPGHRPLAIATLALLLSACGVDRGGITDVDPASAPTSSIALGPGFKSGNQISVAGTPYDTTGATILVDGLVAGLGSIEDGDYVTLTGSVGNPAVATRIAVDHPVIGEVTEVIPAQRQLRILGQQVQVSDFTLFGAPYEVDGLAAVNTGDDLVISGSRLADGRILASRIDSNANLLPHLVAGEVSNLDAVAGSFEIAGTAVSDPSLALPDGYTGLVRLRDFTFVNGVLEAPQIEELSFLLEGVGSDSSTVGVFTGAGPVSVIFEAPVFVAYDAASGEINVGGVPVLADTQTVVIGATLDQLAVDEYVRVTAQIATADNMLTASQIEVLAAVTTAFAYAPMLPLQED